MPQFTAQTRPPVPAPKLVALEDAGEGEVYVMVNGQYVFRFCNTGEIVRYDYIDPEDSGLKVDKQGRAKLVNA